MSRFAIMPARAYDDPRMDRNLRDVLGLLSTYADRDGWCWPGQETLANRLGLTRTSVNKYLRRLVELGYLTSKRRQAGCLYRIAYDADVNPEFTSDVKPAFTSDVNPEFTQNVPKERITPSSSKRGARLADDWAPDQELLTWAAQKAPQVDLVIETEKFVNYWRARSGAAAVKQDWRAAWRVWILKAIKDYGNVHAIPPRHAAGRSRETAEERRDKLRAAVGE